MKVMVINMNNEYITAIKENQVLLAFTFVY